MEKIRKKIKIAGERIDKYLALDLAMPRNQVQKMIKSSKILVNNEPVTVNYRLKLDDEILIQQETEFDEIKKIKKEVKTINKNYELIDKQKDYLIINKPAGLIVHGGTSIKGATLVDLLLADYPELAKTGEDPARPGIIHRLDSMVSGLMIIPRTQEFFDHIKEQFQKRTIKKKYLALVYGEIAKNYDEINFPMKRSSQGFKMAALAITKKGKQNEDGKKAISEFEVKKRFIGYTLVEVKIKTGRTHQVRVHMSAYGYPLLGDSLYNTRKTRDKNEKFNLNRVFLVASNLGFVDLAGEEKNYTLDLPKEMENFINQLTEIKNSEIL